MTLKEELEILRGEPIQVFEGDPMDVPCIETSDPDKLCKNPVVSVHMITYNHEPYIRQAIEGVMMQETDFEFELIIGEDCSQDKTREICFKYQKKYPDRIRVLWWHENVSKLGGNSRRVCARSRGEFIAFCEGDDYWTDPLKLQKQVDVMRGNNSVGLVLTYGVILRDCDGYVSDFPCKFSGLVDRKKMLEIVLESFVFGVITCACMYRRDVLISNLHRLPLLETMRLRCGDTQCILATLTTHAVYFIPEKMVVYRKISTSATGTQRANFFVGRDGLLVRYAYTRMTLAGSVCEHLKQMYSRYMLIYGFSYLPFRHWLSLLALNTSKSSAVFALFHSRLRSFVKRLILWHR